GVVADVTIFHRWPAPRGVNPVGRIRYWNTVMLDANAIDHTPTELLPAPEQGGPHRTSRAFAIVQIAVFDAVNAITAGYQSYTGLPPAPASTSPDSAIAMSAHDTLVALYPSQRAKFDALLAADLAQIPDSGAKTTGIVLGRLAAEKILARRANDGS